MSRLSYRDYQTRRTSLGALWRDHQQAFGLIPGNEQAHLHAFYQPSKTLDALTERQIFQTDPLLRRRAGRAYAHLQHELLRPPAPPIKASRGYQRLSVQAVRKPEIDIPKLVDALLLIMQERAERERLGR